MRRALSGRVFAALALGVACLAAAGSAGCAGSGHDDAPPEGGFFTGYELGNDQDMLDERASRPSSAKNE